ncbi:MAG: hypothetical protein PHY92_06705 [Alphaproteobacteria bacterium]|nr:hypothetical protein [Alphaproteobacteria bacterium]
MNFDEKMKNLIKGRYINLLESLKVKDGVVNIWDNEVDSLLLPLIDIIRKNKDIAEHMNFGEVLSVLNYEPQTFLKKSGNKQNGLLKELLGREEINMMASNVIELFEGLPYENLSYFKLPFNLSEKINAIFLTNEAQIVRMDDNEVQNINVGKGLNLGDLFAGKKLGDIIANDICFKVKTSGYGKASRAKALTILKQFAYLTSASGFIQSQTWDRRGDLAFDVLPKAGLV